MQNTITVKEAIEQGYKYYCYQFEESPLFKLEEYKPATNVCVVVKKDKVPFSISDSLIKELVDDWLCNQDEVYDEDGVLNDIAEKVDYSAATKNLNDAFEVHGGFYYPSTIILVP